MALIDLVLLLIGVPFIAAIAGVLVFEILERYNRTRGQD